MDCPETRLMLAFRRPGGPAELVPEDAAALDRHLAECPVCAALAQHQGSFDAAIGQAMRSVPVPVALHGRLIADAMARRGVIWRRNVTQLATLAATLLVGALTLTGVVLAFRPALNTTLLADDFGQSQEEPERFVQAWLDSRGLPTSLPYDFDYRYYRDHGETEVQGRNVPFILYGMPSQQGGIRPEVAKVFIFRASQFKFDPEEFRATVNSFCTVQVVPDNGRGVAYVILYTTQSIEPFLKPAPPPI